MSPSGRTDGAPFDDTVEESEMSGSGLSKSRLARMHDVLAAHVERGVVPGLVALVSRRGESHVDAIGTTAAGGTKPMQRDTIFRITSMTKPVTAVATMTLVEECKLRLDEPVDRLMPELANRRVLRRIDGPLDDTVPALRPITVRDLLTFRLGFGLIMEPSATWPIQQAVNELRLQTGPPKPRTPHGPDEWIRRLGSLPLMHQPGEHWMYNVGSHVLGVLIARASGQPLGTFLRERIFDPLGMKDTSFVLPSSKRGRLPTCYLRDPASGALEVHDDVDDSEWLREPTFPDAAAGLLSTVGDFMTFAQMLLDQGRNGRDRILSRLAVEAMTTDQLTPAQKAASPFGDMWETHGWGFGVSIVTKRDGVAAVPGRYGWDGGYGTSWTSDPAEAMVGILMTQCIGFPTLSPVYQDFWTSAYQAIDD
jgi:CubicO group peptidase (beta-lactamase class C family)